MCLPQHEYVFVARQETTVLAEADQWLGAGTSVLGVYGGKQPCTGAVCADWGLAPCACGAGHGGVCCGKLTGLARWRESSIVPRYVTLAKMYTVRGTR